MKCLVRSAWRPWVLAPALMLSACSFSHTGFLAAQGPVAQAERGHFFSIIGWMLIVIVSLFVAVPWVL